MNSITKKCSKCKQFKCYGEFSKDKARSDGHSYICKSCDRKKGRKYYSNNIESRREKNRRFIAENREAVRDRILNWQRNNREKCRAYVKKWAENNIEKAKKQEKAWRDRNKERIAAKTKKWANDNKDKRALTAEKRRAAKVASGGKITFMEWEALKEKYGNKCLCCQRIDVVLTLDHVIPLSLGGEHSIRNAQPLCGSCNSSKHKKVIDYRPF